MLIKTQNKHRAGALFAIGLAIIIASVFINIMTAAAAPLLQTSYAVEITVEDANGPLAGQVVYAFDDTGTTYSGLSATSNVTGTAAFTLPADDYLFASDDVNGTRYWTTPACTVPTCTAETLTMPVMGVVEVTVEDANGPLAGQVVYAFDGTGTTYAGLSATSNVTGTATFTLPADDYLFASDDVNGTRYWTSSACLVPTCTVETLTMPVMGVVEVTVEDANGPLAGQVVYAFDGTGTIYSGLSATSNVTGTATFTLPADDYLFASDDVNSTRYWTTPACTVPTCTAETLTMPVMGVVEVTVEDANGPLAGQVVYAFDGTGTTYSGLSATSNVTGTATFTLPADDYLFASDDINSTRYWSSLICTVPTCTTATINMQIIGIVEVTIEDANGPLDNRVIYAFDGTGTTYSGLSATSNVTGTATFTLPADDYLFASDDVNGTRYWTTPACTVPTCTAETLTMPVMGVVEVTVEDANGPLAGQVVYAFDGTGTTYSGLSATSNVTGTATFTLPADDYLFASDDVNGTRYWTTPACTVPTCTAETLTMPVMGVVEVTVENVYGPLDNRVVYAFDGTGTTYSGLSATTNVSGTATFTLPADDYLFASDDVDSTRYWSSPVCTVVTCTTATVTIPVFGVDVTVTDLANNLMANQVVYAYDGATDTGLSAQTDALGVANLMLPAGPYRFVTNFNGMQYESDAVNHCTVPSCTTAAVQVMVTTLPAATCTSTGLTSRTCDLWATTGSITLPDGNIVTIWGYADTLTGTAQLPGPALIVNEGETITINLVNTLTEDTAIFFQGIDMVPDLVGAAASGGTTTYTFIANAPGTYLYEAGLLPNAQHQVAMGMYGALIVRPTTAGQAYNDPATAYDDEAVVILSEIDPALNNSADPATFDMRHYAPTYALINGKAFPDTQEILTAAGNNVLLRYINAGLQNHSISLLGMDQTLLAIDASPRPYAHAVVGEIMSAGTTVDILATVPISATDGSQFALYDADLLLHNNNGQGFGGMLTFLTIPVGPPSGGDTVGPITDPVAVSPSPTDGLSGITITATTSDVDTGNSNIAIAEYFIDTIGADGTGTAMLATDGTFDFPTEIITATISAIDLDALGLAAGEHTIYVHGQDAAGNWGSFNLTILQLVNEGPVTIGITLTHDPSAGDTDVLLSATGDDTATGNSNIVDAEYFINVAGADGTGIPMSVNVAAPIASLDAIIPFASIPAEGVHTIYIHNKDAFNHWGPLETIDLQVDQTGPGTTALTVAPNPNNGLQPINPSQFSVRIDATLDDPIVGVTGSSLGFQSNLYEAEYYLDLTGLSVPIPNPNEGEGAPMYPRDGIFDSTNEDTYAFISLITINSLPDGTYSICVRGRDAAGNWGACSFTDLIIDRGLPTVSNVAATPNPTGGATTTVLTALGSSSGFAIDMAEWFTGADPGLGNGSPMSVTPNGADWDLEDSIDLTGWAAGTHTLYVRARTTAGNWSATELVVLDINTAAPVYGVTLTPATDAKPSTAGSTVTYLLDVTNTGNVADTYDITVSGNVWATSATPITVVSLAAGSTAQITVDVVVGAGANDTAVITATSQGSPTPLSDASTLTTSSVQDLLYFSTVGNFAVPGVAGPYDDADVYSWDGSSFSRIFDARVAGNPGGINLPGNADIDGLVVADSDTIYMSFSRNAGVNVPGIGIVEDEDIVLYDAGVWSLYFDGNEVGLGDSNGEDVDAFEILPDGSILLSAVGNFNPDPDFAINRRDEDVIRCVPSGGLPITACTWSDYFDGSDVGLNNGGGEDVLGIAVKDGDLYLSTLGAFNVSGLSGNGFDVFSCDTPTVGSATSCTSFSMYFDGSVEGVTDRIDAIDLP